MIDKAFGEYDNKLRQVREELAASERSRLELEKENRTLKTDKTSGIGGMEELIHIVAMRNKEEEFARYQSKLFLDSQQSQEREKLMQSLIVRNSELERQVSDLQKTVATLGIQLSTKEKSTNDSDRLASTLHKEYFSLKDQALREIAKRDAEIVTLRQNSVASMAAVQESERRRVQEVESIRQRAESGYRELQLLNQSLQQRNTDLERRIADISGAFQAGQFGDEKVAKEFFNQIAININQEASNSKQQLGEQMEDQAGEMQQPTIFNQTELRKGSGSGYLTSGFITNQSPTQEEARRYDKLQADARFGKQTPTALAPDLSLLSHPLAILLPNRPY